MNALSHAKGRVFGHIIAEHNATGGAALKQYIWLGDTPLAVFDNATLYYVHPDHLDRPVVMTNASAMTIAWQAKYDPFGVPVAVTVTPTNTQRLPGQWFLSEDGFSYNWHRTYDPTLGRYTQADPLGFVDGPSKYNYVDNNPLVAVDPTGESKKNPNSNAGAGWSVCKGASQQLRIYGIDGQPLCDFECHGDGRHGGWHGHFWNGKDRGDPLPLPKP